MPAIHVLRMTSSAVHGSPSRLECFSRATQFSIAGRTPLLPWCNVPKAVISAMALSVSQAADRAAWGWLARGSAPVLCGCSRDLPELAEDVVIGDGLCLLPFLEGGFLTMQCAQGSPHKIVGALVASTFNPAPDEVVRIGSEVDVAIDHESLLLEESAGVHCSTVGCSRNRGSIGSDAEF